MLLGARSLMTMIADKQFGSLAGEPIYCIKLRCYLHAWIAQPYVLLFNFDKCREIWRESPVTDHPIAKILKLVDYSPLIEHTFQARSLSQISTFSQMHNRVQAVLQVLD